MNQPNAPAAAQRSSGRRRSVKFTKKTVLAAGALPVAAALAFAATGTANAVTTGTYTVPDVFIRTAPNGGEPIGEGQPGQVAYVYCWTTGTTVGGSDEWVYNADHTTGVSGYSAAGYLSWNGTITHCE